jgi:glycosyltransferase involved in cell wall biosynthesis
MNHITLFVPGPLNAISGGYIYDRRIVGGLRDAGHTVDVAELAGAFPVTDTAARDAVCATWEALPESSRPVVDGLALPAFSGMEDALAARHAVGLIHHPTALETGFSEADRATLAAAEKRVLPALGRVIVTSESTAEQLAKDFSVDRDRIRIVVPGTDDAPRSPGSGGPACRIVSVGTLIPRKGHDVLLRALARLFDLDWQLTIVGSLERDPVHAQTLAALAEELGIARRVSFAGEVTGEALEAVWRGADVFALATHWEGYGMAIAEALKRGLPVAVTGGGAAGALVTGEAGVVVPPGDAANLSKALRRVIFGTELRHGMAEAAWQVGQTLPDWQTQAHAFAQALVE